MHTQRSYICHSKNFDAKDGNDCYNTNREAGWEGVAAGVRIEHRSDSKTMHEELSSTEVRRAGGFNTTDELLQSGWIARNVPIQSLPGRPSWPGYYSHVLFSPVFTWEPPKVMAE